MKRSPAGSFSATGIENRKIIPTSDCAASVEE